MNTGTWGVVGAGTRGEVVPPLSQGM